MASQMNVVQLLTELSKRGLGATGTKPPLHQKRLQGALLKEGGGNKGNDDAGDNAFETITNKRGRDRSLNDNNGGGSSNKKVKVVEEAKEKIVTATKKGGAILDEGIPDHIKANYHVLKEGDAIYDATFNLTNVGNNNNKYFVIQVLESDDYKTYMVHNRWGRVGTKGQSKLRGPYTVKRVAVRAFEATFFSKTKNYWCNRMNFLWYPGCYTWLEMDYGGKEKESADVKKKTDSSIGFRPRERKLDQRVANFISLICNISMMKQQMMEIGYSADKLPLGKLSKSTILKGYDVLRRIADVIDQSTRTNLEQLSSEFYSVIPHDFGYRKMCEFVIDTPQKLKKKLEMVEDLGEIELATKLLIDGPTMEEDPFYYCYRQLHCELIPLDNDSEEFAMIAKYTQNTHVQTHAFYTVDIVQIFEVAREGESERFKKFSATKNRMLLWHGSRLTNWTGILSQGLRIAPPEAPASGSSFGKGVYFADMFSKSASYSCGSSLTTGVLLLCEVALGDMAELLRSKPDADKLPYGKLSTKGIGATAPDPSEVQILDDGVVVPIGKPKTQQPMGGLPYNEYIVYNVDQIRMRYLVQVNFKQRNQFY